MHHVDIPLDKAELLATILEGILYGFSLLMFGGTIRQLMFRRCNRKMNIKMVMVACLLLACSTVHLVIDIIRIIEGLILRRETYPGGPIAYFASVSQWTFVSKNYIYVVHTLIGDGVVLYRCYVVWQSKAVMILPVLLWLAIAATGFTSAYAESRLGAGDSVFCDILSVWIKAFYAAAFSTNVLTTFLLAYRIWYVDQKAAKVRGHSESQLRCILRTVIDAGALYSLTLLAMIVAFTLKSNGQYVLLDMLMPIISIAFYMVIIRVGMFSDRTMQPWMAPRHSHTWTDDSFCADAGNSGMQGEIVTTFSGENKVDEDQRSPTTSSISATVEESHGYRSEANHDDSGDAV